MRIKHIVVVAVICIATSQLANAQSTPPTAPSPPPASSTKAPVSRVVKKGDAQMALAIKRVPPHYPESARAQGTQGTVRLDTIIDTDGRVIETKYISGPRELVHASIDAVKQWRFKPTIVDGDPVQVECVFEFSFALHG